MKIGDPVDLVCQQQDLDMKYRSKILDYTKDRIQISVPVNQDTDKSEWLFEGVPLEVYIKGDGEVLRFNSEIIGKNDKDDVSFLTIHYPEHHQVESIQRRDFVRVDSHVDVAIHPVQPAGKPFVTTTVDLSAGGVAVNLLHDQALNTNDRVSLWLVLPEMSGDLQYIKTTAQVVRIFGKETERKASLKFESLDENNEQAVLRYCFERELILKNKKGIKGK